MYNSTEIVVLASGGMDSTVLLYDLVSGGADVVPLFVDYGQHCAETERLSLEANAPVNLRNRIEYVDVSQVYKAGNSRLVREADLWSDNIVAEDLYLPYRNLLLLSVGAAFAQSMEIPALGAAFINSNHAKEIDCSAAFLAMLAEVLGQYGSVRLIMPYRYLNKAEVARRGIVLGVPIAETYSCQASSAIPCGACPNCVDRLEALRDIRSRDGN